MAASAFPAKEATRYSPAADLEKLRWTVGNIEQLFARPVTEELAKDLHYAVGSLRSFVDLPQ